MAQPRSAYPPYVTHELLDARLAPLSANVAEIKADVKTLLAFQAATVAADEATEKERRRGTSSSRFVVTTIVLLATGLVSAVATLVWLATS